MLANYRQTKALNFSNLIHRHPDQWKLINKQKVRVQEVKKGKEVMIVEVPEYVNVPLSERLHQALVDIDPAVHEPPVRRPKPAPVETFEAAEARRRKARDVMRKKIARDFSKGGCQTVVREG